MIKSPASEKTKKFLVFFMIITVIIFFSSCSIQDILKFQNESNTVKGIADLSNRISEEAKKGVEETVLFVEDITENEIQNITDNMGLFWGAPTEYVIVKAIPEDNTLKVKFFIEKSNNYYVVNNYLNGEEIPENKQEASSIAEALKKMIDKNIDEDMTDYEKELAIHDWLVKKIDYDENIDASSTDNGSYGAMVNKKTMCRGYAEAMKLISECCGLKTQIIVGNAIDQNGENVSHAWNLVNVNGKWYHLDVTHDDPIGDDGKNIHYFYFNLNDNDIRKDHSWEREYFPLCESDSYMYYKKNSIYYTNLDDFKSGIKTTLQYDKPSYIEILLEANKLYESQLQFIWDLGTVRSISWSTHGKDPMIVCITPNYY